MRRFLLIFSAIISSAPALALEMPPDEVAFIDAVMRAKRAYETSSTDLQKGAARPARARDICRALASRSISGWAGKIATLTTNGDGKGVIEISIARDIKIGTWNNAVSDAVDRTIIEPSSPLYEKALSLKIGQDVIFSGAFIPSDTDCAREQSVTLAGSLQEPAFLMRFSKIRTLDESEADPAPSATREAAYDPPPEPAFLPCVGRLVSFGRGVKGCIQP